MKRLTLLLLGLALGVSATASAQGLTMQMSNGWAFQFSGNVNAFWVFSKVNNSGPANSSVRTGLLPAFATFEARGKEAGMNLAVHFGFAPQIQNAGVHDQFGTQIDMRQVYLTIGMKNGSQILATREDLGSVFHPDGQVDLAHVDLRAELVVDTSVLDLRRKAEVNCQVHAGFLAARFECREGWEQSGADAAIRRTAVVHFRKHPEGVHVPGKLERPSVGHLHRQALRAGRRGDAQRQAQQQQRETLHTRSPPWEFTSCIPTARASRRL